MTSVATPPVAPPSSAPRPRRPWRGVERSWPARVAIVLAALPLVVAAVAIVVKAPAIDWSGDRALTELAVREAARGRQLLGLGGRFGWRHPGPLWLQLLVPGYELSGHAPWSLSVGVLAIHVSMVVIAVAGVARGAGSRGAALLAAAVAVYLRATGLAYWTNLWAGYAFTWPFLALIVVAALATAERRAGWAVPVALLIGTLLVQTDASMVAPVVVLCLVMVVLRMIRAGPRRFLAREPSPAKLHGRASAPATSNRPSVVALGLLALAVAAWVPPIVEQVTTNPGNMTLLVRFARQGGGGYPLRTAAAAVGAAISVFPLGARWVLRPGVQARLGAGPWWAVGVAAGTVVVSLLAAIVGWRRGRTFAADLALFSAVGVVAAIVTMSRVQGPLNYYLLTWITVVPLAALTAIVLVLAPAPRRHRATDALTVIALVVAAAVTASVVAAQGTSHDWDRRASTDVSVETALTTRAIGTAAGGLIYVHVLTSDTWEDAAGVALQLERGGARIEVDSRWVFLFGDAFKPRTAPPDAELWFARPHEAPLLKGRAGVLQIAAVDGVDVFARMG